MISSEHFFHEIYSYASIAKIGRSLFPHHSTACRNAEKKSTSIELLYDISFIVKYCNINSFTRF